MQTLKMVTVMMVIIDSFVNERQSQSFINDRKEKKKQRNSSHCMRASKSIMCMR